MNSVQLSGRLTHDPEVKQTNNGLAVCSFRLAVKRPFKGDTTDFFQFKAWRQTAEYLGKWCHKGDTLGVNGVLTVEQYEDRDGIKHTNYVISADNVEKLSSDRQQSQQTQQAPAPLPTDDFEEILSDEGVPF